MVFEDVEIPVSVKVDASELKQLIKDFDGSADAAKRLEAATDSVKSQFSAQRQAIMAVNQANRINNFQLMESLRLIRSATSLFSNLNSVYQTLLLRQISTTQTTVAQREAFEKVAGSVPDIVNALSILGSKNIDVQGGIDGLNTSLQSMSSDSIQKLIDQWKAAGEGADLSGDSLIAFNKELTTMTEILKEVKLKEKQKEFNDFFGSFLNIAQTATGLGTFAIALKSTATGVKLLNAAFLASPYVIAFLAAVAAIDIAGQSVTGTSIIKETERSMGIENPQSLQEKMGIHPATGGLTGMDDYDKYITDSGWGKQVNITLNVDKLKVDDTGADLGGWLEKAHEYSEQKKSQRIR